MKINYKGHEISLQGTQDNNIIVYVDTTILTVPNFAALDMYIMNINSK